MLSQESDDVHKFVAYGDTGNTHRQVLQPLRVGLLLTTRFLFAGKLLSSAMASFLPKVAMLRGQYRGHCIDVGRKGDCHAYHWLVILDALRSSAKRAETAFQDAPAEAETCPRQIITTTGKHVRLAPMGIFGAGLLE